MLIGIDASRTTIARRTGTEVYSLQLIRHLVRLRPDWQFRLYFNQAPSDEAIPTATHVEWRIIPFPRLWTHLRLSAEVTLRPPDLLFVPAHVLPILHPRRSVVTVHDVGHRYHPEAHPPAQRHYLEWSTRYHTRAATHLLADSQATRNDLIRFYNADPTRITVVHLGIDADFRPVQDPAQIAAVKAKYGIKQPYILYLGTLQPRKNLTRLIQAFARLQREDITLVLAGKQGWLSEDLQAQAQATGVGTRVLLTGFVDDADRPALYSGATLFVMPSLYEGFCFPVLEAMACGTPVVCSNVASLPEVGGDAARFFDPTDVEAMATAIAQTLDDPFRCAHMRARGLEHSKTFTWERCARQTATVLEQVSNKLP